jgi:hypothetical protein
MQDTGKFRDTKDQFYTKRAIAEICVKEIYETLPWASAEETLWVEPSAGAGAFLGIGLPKTVIAIDKEPKHAGVLRGDFLTWEAPVGASEKPLIFFGNPPFGRQGSIAKKFLEHCCEQGADALAFILPRSFMKPSMCGCIPAEFHLLLQTELPKNSFEVNKKDYDVPCVFQIWERQATPRPPPTTVMPIGFEYVKPQSPYDLAFRRVGGLAGKCYTPANGAQRAHSIQAHHFLKFAPGTDIKELQKKINSHIFPSNTTGPRSLSKGEINSVINLFMLPSAAAAAAAASQTEPA